MGPWRVRAEPSVLAALGACVLSDPVAATAAGELLRATWGRRTARLALPGVGDVLLKLDRSRGFEERLRSLWFPSRPRAEWDAAWCLRSAGISTAEPLALAERRMGWTGRLDLYVARWLPDVEPLGDRLAASSVGDASVLLARVGRLVAQLQAVLDHQDLHAGNVLVGAGAPEDCSLCVIDLHRSRAGPCDARAARLGLATLVESLSANGTRDGELIVALAPGWSPGADPARLVQALAPLIARLRRRRWRKVDGFALGEGPFFVRHELDGLRGLRRPYLSPERIARLLADHDAALAAHDVRVLKDRPKSAVTRHGDLVVKETRLPGLRARSKRWLARWFLTAGHVNAFRLELRGVRVACSLAYLRRGPRTFTLYHDLSRLERLDARVRALYPAGPAAERHALREGSARWLAGLHARGIYHGDVKALHVFVEGEATAPGFVLIDTDRLRIGRRRVGLTRRLKNLAQLAASIPVCVSRSERLRWWRAYAQALGAGDDERRVARRLARLLARKTRVVHDPLE